MSDFKKYCEVFSNLSKEQQIDLVNYTTKLISETQIKSAKEELERHYNETSKILIQVCVKPDTVSMDYVILIKVLEDAYLQRLKELEA
jgi:hypothetical protein